MVAAVERGGVGLVERRAGADTGWEVGVRLAVIAADAARRYSSTTPTTSSVLRARGTGMSCRPVAVNIALAVVLAVEVGGDAVGSGAVARHGRHRDPVRQLVGAERGGVQRVMIVSSFAV
jgi:hypothetical protein